jgi:hypothetical protein
MINGCYDVAYHGCYFLLNGKHGLVAANGCTLLSNCGFEKQSRERRRLRLGRCGHLAAGFRDPRHKKDFESLEIGTEDGGVHFGSDWKSPNLAQLGEHRLWVDKKGRLRMKKGAPTSDEDGATVGS